MVRPAERGLAGVNGEDELPRSRLQDEGSDPPRRFASVICSREECNAK